MDELQSLAVLAGFTTDMSLKWRLRPDVVKMCPSTAQLFVGDAKATESSKCAATMRRLRWYSIAIAGMSVGGATTVALAVPVTSKLGWERALSLSLGVHLICETPRRTVLGPTAIVATRATAR